MTQRTLPRISWRILTRPQIYVPITILLVASVGFAAFGKLEGEVEPTLDALPLLALAALVNMIAIPLWAIRTQLVLTHLGYHADLRSLVLLTTFANVGNQILPAAGGELARGTYLSKLHDVPASSTAAALVFERLFGFLLMMATAFGAVVALKFGFVYGVMGGLAAVLLSGVALIAIGRSRTDAERKSAKHEGKLRQFLAALANTSGEVRTLASRPGLVLVFTMLSLAVYGVLTVGFVLSASAMGVSLNGVEGWALHGSGMTIGTLSAIPFGLGASEAAIATIGALAGLSVVSTLAAAVGMRIALTVPLGILGAMSYLVLSKRLGDKLSDTANSSPRAISGAE